jgi:hypothetical protein
MVRPTVKLMSRVKQGLVEAYRVMTAMVGVVAVRASSTVIVSVAAGVLTQIVCKRPPPDLTRVVVSVVIWAYL